MVLLGLLASASAQPLAAVGERIAGLSVVDVLEHPEFERIHVVLPDGRILALEVTATEQFTGACTHHGLSLSPRWELLGESVALEEQPPVVDALCQRLAERGASLSLRPPRTELTKRLPSRNAARCTDQAVGA